MHLGKNQLLRCKYGWMLFNGPYIGKCFELYGQYSEEEVRVMRSFIRPGDTAIDVGANIGDLTVPMAGFAGEAGRVYAFESHSTTFNTLCANLALNEIVNTRPINAFVADSDKVDTASPVWGELGYVSRAWKPPFLSIDSLALERCDFIKIDVDGNELAVLRSGVATIARARPIIYLENDVREKSAALFDELMRSDYTLYWHPAPIFEAENFFGNPVNHWAPQTIISQMILCLPREKAAGARISLRPVADRDEWWS